MLSLSQPKTAGEKLVDLLDYVEQVLRLDENVAFRLAQYRLPDGARLALRRDDLAGLPGIAFDTVDADAPAWLALDRLARAAPPSPPESIAAWVAPSLDPDVPPVLLAERVETVTDVERQALIAAGRAAEEDFAPAPAAAGGDPRHDLRLRLAGQPSIEAACRAWLADTWRAWAEAEGPRRRTIAIYGALYRIQQLLELGGGEGSVEVVWGIGTVRWARDGQSIDRPLIECGVELELSADGRILVRPTESEPRVDLKPYEDFGCTNLAPLEDLVRAEFARVAADDGVSPFRPESFEPLLAAAATRLAAEGLYRDHGTEADTIHDGPLVTGDWVLFARPRSRHVALDDVARFRAATRSGIAVAGLAERLVTPPSEAAPPAWQPLDDGQGTGTEPMPDGIPGAAEVFFPKPFNEDQIAIVRQLREADGLVVQGPPGTGKTHTIANLICHAMALGQRVLVVSRGEAALSVLRDQLPEKVRPLAIAILSSERQGLRQVETAIREIQSVVEGSRPQIRTAAVRRCQAEIVKIQGRLAAIDRDIDGMAARQHAPIGPDEEAPAELARRLAAGRDSRPWFDDEPDLFAVETGISDRDIEALRAARGIAGAALDHCDARLPAVETLPSPERIAAWHDELVAGRGFAETALLGPVAALRISPAAAEAAQRAGRAVEALASAVQVLDRQPWLPPLLLAHLQGEETSWTAMLREICDRWRQSELARARLATFAIDLPDGIENDAEASAAIERAARGERPWPRLSLGQNAARESVAAVRMRGHPLGTEANDWEAVAAQVRLLAERRDLAARWRHLANGRGLAPGEDPGDPDPAERVFAALDKARLALSAPGLADGSFMLPGVDTLAADPGLALALARQLAWAAGAARCGLVAEHLAGVAAAFTGADRTSTMARDLLGRLVGRTDLDADRVSTLWGALLVRIGDIAALRAPFAEIARVAALIEAAGAPRWAGRLRADPDDQASPEHWRDAWDAAAGEKRLAAIDERTAFSALVRERDALDRRARKLFVELVRERSFDMLERRLSPSVKSALVEYVRALGRLGKGTGKGSGRHRRTARDAMARCYDAVPCWIMPTWRVAEQLPSEMASFDLVILDEASQSDITDLPALLRGRKILAVGDDRQVSPQPPFVSQVKIDALRHRYLRDLPYRALLEPGESLYDLMRAVFPDSRLMLREHFRCVEPIIRFSMQFYPEKLLPLRVPAASERLDPPLVDILVPHGFRDGARKINRPEAEVIVDEIAALAADPAHAGRSIGVISLIGGEQAELVRVLLAERIGNEAMQRHRVLCSDSAGFQGNERDVVFLSMVADRKRRSTLTMLRYEQRFNVAASRARDRLVLVRSVSREDLAAEDLKARLIAHFEDPMPSASVETGQDLASRCESEFERDVLRQLIARGYRVEPQVGAEGFRIDLVVEDVAGRRLAVECDGDSFHGPERWREDVRRQRILERVGWRFWRCFASTFYRDPEGVMSDLVVTLDREGIQPADGEAHAAASARLVEHRIAATPAPPLETEPPAQVDASAAHGTPGRIRAGDRVALLFPDRRLTLRLTDGVDDHAGGLLSITTPLGEAVARSEEGEEIELAQASGPATRVLVEAVERRSGAPRHGDDRGIP